MASLQGSRDWNGGPTLSLSSRPAWYLPLPPSLPSSLGTQPCCQTSGAETGAGRGRGRTRFWVPLRASLVRAPSVPSLSWRPACSFPALCAPAQPGVLFSQRHLTPSPRFAEHFEVASCAILAVGCHFLESHTGSFACFLSNHIWLQKRHEAPSSV